ncbi:MAG: methyltransferase domain-containing protein [Proteobacteria bacterium]|nr:methyltransferase domain-containing protein [Pseudomonadota bacterium]MDA1022546.1 methyltransferase domain-containing protein [Pseudomonadota bacterium]
MWTDVVDLRDFYASVLGQVARRMIRRRMRILWPDVTGQSVLGIGYATPYLNSFRSNAERVLAVMPAGQGVLRWPPDEPGLTALVDECELPFPDLSIDRVLLVHALECSEQARPLMREVWRILSASGRLLVVVPNRSGVWARFEHTPFGHGLPHTPGQLSRLLRDNLFTPIESHRALFVPPIHSRMLLGSAPAWEKIGERAFKTFSGVVMTEAVKQIYAAGTTPSSNQRRRYLPVPGQTPTPRRDNNTG